jgi:hypothetical protein
LQSVIDALHQAAQGKIEPEAAIPGLRQLVEAPAVNLPQEHKELINKVLLDNQLTPDEMNAVQQSLQQSSAGQAMIQKMTDAGVPHPIAAAMQQITAMPQWAQGAMMLGLPLALIGLSSAVLGEGGMMHLLVGALGASAVAGGLGMFGTHQGPLTNFGKQTGASQLGPWASNLLGNTSQVSTDLQRTPLTAIPLKNVNYAVLQKRDPAEVQAYFEGKNPALWSDLNSEPLAQKNRFENFVGKATDSQLQELMNSRLSPAQRAAVYKTFQTKRRLIREDVASKLDQLYTYHPELQS